MTRPRCVALSLGLALLGYVGAAVFYSYLIGLNWQTPLACLVCPHILSMGDPFHKFVRRVMILGTLNATLFLAIGWLFVGAARLGRRIVDH